jgi:hypothetical protein
VFGLAFARWKVEQEKEHGTTHTGRERADVVDVELERVKRLAGGRSGGSVGKREAVARELGWESHC